MVFDIFFDDAPTRKRIGKTERQMLYKVQGGRCMYCGRKLSLADMHVDHKTPVVRRGSNSMSNLQLLCAPCNTRKGDMTEGEFRRAYKLTPSREAKGPPKKTIGLKHFEGISKTIAQKKAKDRQRRDNDYWL